jgi:hypothetical protein
MSLVFRLCILRCTYLGWLKIPVCILESDRFLRVLNAVYMPICTIIFIYIFVSQHYNDKGSIYLILWLTTQQFSITQNTQFCRRERKLERSLVDQH